MMVYPTLELKAGKVVSLVRGRLDSPEIWNLNPIALGREWAAMGASWMHVTDFDGVDGATGNDAVIEDLIRSVGIPVQLGGGIRSAERAAHWIENGAARVVIGSLAVTAPDTVQSLANIYPDQIVLSVDVWKGRVMTDGWRNESAIAPNDLIAAYDGCPLAAILVTDIESDIEDTEASMGVISGLASEVRAPVIASGVVRQADDIARLKYVPGVDGVLVGRALMKKTIDLADALAVAQPEPAEKVAEFI